MRCLEILFVTTLIQSAVRAGSFCTDPSDYECKDQGITKCAPKSNRSVTDKPLPIEKPPCAVPCPDNFYWCEERGSCIGRGEECDCGPDKIYCTSADAYSCESRKGILQSHIFNICPDGSCQHVRNNCSVSRVMEALRTEECRNGQFRCGTACLDNAKIAEFRDCDGECVSVHQSCYKAGAGEEISEMGNSLVIILISILIAVLLFLLCMIGVVYYMYYTRNKQRKDVENVQTPAKDAPSKVLLGTGTPQYTSTPRQRSSTNKNPIIKGHLKKPSGTGGRVLFNNSYLDSSYEESNYKRKNNYKSLANKSPSKQNKRNNSHVNNSYEGE